MPIKVKNWDKQPRDKGEDELQEAFFAWYEYALKPLGVVAWHARNENSINAVQGAIMKRRGVLAGVHDVVLEWPWRNKATIELKSPKKRPSQNKYSDSQQGYAEAMDRVGFPHACCQNGEQIIATLKSWGLNPLYPWPPINKGAGKYVRQTVVFHELYRRHDDDEI